MLNLGKQVSIEKKFGVPTLEQRKAGARVVEEVRRQHLEPTAGAGAGAQTHSATGRLRFVDDGRDLHYMLLELWARRRVGDDVLLGRGMSDREGRFTIAFTPGALPLQRVRIELCVHETDFIFSADGRPIEHHRPVHGVPYAKPVRGSALDFGVVDVPFWPYDPTTPVVRAGTVAGGLPPQLAPQGYLDTAIGKTKPVSLKRIRHHLLSRLRPGRPTLRQIQLDYPENLTLAIERDRPGHTRSDAWLGERVMNGFNPCLLSRDLSHPGWYRVTWNWDSSEMNGRYDMPNVDGRFELRDGRLFPVQITIQRRKPGGLAPRSPLEEPQTYTPADGEKWEQAKRVFRCAYILAGECDAHFAQTHLNAEQLAIAAWRNLRLNPLRFLLFPHLKEVVRINWRGNQLIFGDTGIVPRTSPITVKGFGQRFREYLATQDWKGWRPRQPLSEHHLYARVANLYWDVVTEHVEAFFREHEQGIAAHWWEVHRFSTDLVEHSVPYQPRPADPIDDWFDRGELDKPEIPRVEAGGALRSVRPITQSDTPSADDLENLKEACRFAIFQATFNHSYSNVRQYDDGGEVLYASFGLRNGCMGAESDSSVAVAPEDATDTIFLALLLSTVRYGTMMKNEDGDVPPGLIERLRSRRGDFAALGFDIDEIASRTNI